MKTHIKNIEINSSHLHSLQKWRKESFDIWENIFLKNSQVLEDSQLFQIKILKKWEYLFKEWEVDENFYIIKQGLLSVEKFTTKDQKNTKQLALLEAGDFLGEAGMDGKNTPKQTNIKSLQDSILYSIDIQKDLPLFIEKYPKIWYDFLKYIILETNARLNEANQIIASQYEIEKSIQSLKSFSAKNIFSLIDKICQIVKSDYILYFEKHQILDNFLILKYDSRHPNIMQDKVFEKSGYFLDFEELLNECNIGKDEKASINKLSIWDEVYWYFIFVKEKYLFSESDRKIFQTLSNSFAWVLKKFFTDKEQKNIQFIEDGKR